MDDMRLLDSSATNWIGADAAAALSERTQRLGKRIFAAVSCGAAAYAIAGVLSLGWGVAVLAPLLFAGVITLGEGLLADRVWL